MHVRTRDWTPHILPHLWPLQTWMDTPHQRDGRLRWKSEAKYETSNHVMAPHILSHSVRETRVLELSYFFIKCYISIIKTTLYDKIHVGHHYRCSYPFRMMLVNSHWRPIIRFEPQIFTPKWSSSNCPRSIPPATASPTVAARSLFQKVKFFWPIFRPSTCDTHFNFTMFQTTSMLIIFIPNSIQNNYDFYAQTHILSNSYSVIPIPIPKCEPNAPKTANLWTAGRSLLLSLGSRDICQWQDRNKLPSRRWLGDSNLTAIVLTRHAGKKIPKKPKIFAV